MTTAVATSAANVPTTWSLGPFKIQLFDVTLISGNTVVTVTADRMSSVKWATLSEPTQTAAPTYSGATATFTVTDPAATVYAQALVIGI